MKAKQNGIELSFSEGITEKIQFYSEGTIRCTESKIPLRPSLVVKDNPKNIDFSTTENESSYILSKEKIKIVVSKSDGNITFFKDSTLLLEEYEKPVFKKSL